MSTEQQPQQLTVKDFRAAMVIVENYCQQIYELKNNIGAWRTVTVKWEGLKKPVSMHISQVELTK